MPPDLWKHPMLWAAGSGRCGDRERGLEPIGALVADRPAERFEEVIPVEQLERAREGPARIQRIAAAPSDTKQIRSAS